jgi:hypothetical protein
VAGIAAAANAAQNLVMVANQRPDLAAQLAGGVAAAVNLARGIAQGDSARVPVSKMGAVWQEELQRALRLAVSQVPAVDANGASIDAEAFIAARSGEIATALGQGPAKDPAKGAGRG